MRLTDVAIRQLPFTETGQKRVRDDLLPGFGVTVGTRTKTFFVMFGKDRRLKTLGQWPQISLKDARAEAKRVLAHPTPKKREETRFRDALEMFMDDQQARLRPHTLHSYGCTLRQVEWEKLTDHQPVTQPHRLKALKLFYNWCVEHDLIDRNPYLGKAVVFGVRERVLTDDEIAAIWSYDHPPYSDILKALILTGQRRNQIWKFDPDWIEDDVLTFPGSVMKSKRPHSIPLTGYEPFLAPYSFNSWSKAKLRLNKHVGFDDWVLHDIRRYFSTTMAKLGTPLHVTEQIMDHRSQVTGVAAVYNRWGFIPEMREALQRYDEHIRSVVAQGQSQP